MNAPEMILHNGKISTLDEAQSQVSAVAMAGGRIVAVGGEAPLDVRKAARAGVPMPQHQHNATCHEHGCAHALQQLITAAETARNRYAGFFGTGCDCFAF